MKKFLLILHEDLDAMQKLAPAEMQQLVAAHMDWAAKLAAQGHMLGGDGLEPQGIQIQGRDCVIKDGPYIESKEMIGGYYLLQAADLKAVEKVALECPCHLWGGTTEIRPIMNYE